LRYAPRVIIIDKLASYGAARKQMRLSIEHRQHKGLNNRAENSHQPTRQKERQMKKFKSPGKAQRFLSAHGPINNLFRPRRHLLKATAYRAAPKQAFSTWLEAIDHAVAA
jgi:putative transposase